MPDEITREEQFLSAIAGESVDTPEPITREEMFLAKIAGGDVETPEPITREECLLDQLVSKILKTIAKVLKIKGNTIVWNQLVKDNFTDATKWRTSGNGTFNLSVSDNVLTIETVAESGIDANSSLRQNPADNLVAGHKYLYYAEINPSATIDVRFLYATVADGTRVDRIVANTWTPVGGVISMLTSRDELFYFNLNRALSNGGTASFRNYNIFDLTKMLGSTLADSIYSMEQSQAGSGVAYFRKLFPLDYYSYESGKLLNFGVASHGTGKNLYNEAEAENKWIDINGNFVTTRATARLYGISASQGQTYTFSNANASSATNVLLIAFYGNNSLLGRYTISSGQTYITQTAPSGTDTVYFGLFTYTEAENVMAELGSTPSPYEPYTSNVSIQTVGKNLFDMNGLSGTGENGLNSAISNGVLTVSGTATGTGGFIAREPSNLFLKAGTYKLSSKNPVHNRVRFFLFDENYQQTATPTINAGNTEGNTFTLTDDAYRIRIYMFTTAGEEINDSFEFQIESGSTATAYEPYQSSTKELPISTYFPNGMKSAGSVFDELTPSKAIKRVGSVDLGTLSWRRLQYQSSYYYFRGEGLDIAFGTDGQKANIICPIYESVNTGTANLTDKTVTNFATQHLVLIRDDSIADADSFAQTVSGVILNYELATPVETAITENLNYTVYSGGTEELLPIDDISTSPFSANIDYPSGNEDVYFTVRESAII